MNRRSDRGQVLAQLRLRGQKLQNSQWQALGFDYGGECTTIADYTPAQTEALEWPALMSMAANKMCVYSKLLLLQILNTAFNRN